MKYPSYPEYKDSGVEWLGEVPEHWEVRRLKHISEVYLSNIDKHSVEGQRDVLLCNYVDVYKNEKITSQIDFMRSTASDDQINRLTIFKDDVIITKDSETPSDIGVSALVIEYIPDLVCGYHLALVRPSASSGGFLHYLFKSGFVRAVFEVGSNGLTRYGLGKYSIENLTFASPSKTEQQAIANFLDTKTSLIDDLIAKKEKQIELLKEKRTAIINRAVTKGLDPNVPMKDSGIDWLGDIPEHWRITKLKYAASKIIDCPHETPVYDPDGEYLVIRTADVFEGVLDLSNAYRLVREEYIKRTRRLLLEPDDIVYGREGERYGYAALVPEEVSVCLGQRMMQFRADQHFSPYFLMWQLNSNAVYRQGQIDTVGATSPHVNVETIRNYILTEPPLPEQKEIAEKIGIRCTNIDVLASKLRTQIDKLREYRQSLISAAVTGKINIRCEDL